MGTTSTQELQTHWKSHNHKQRFTQLLKGQAMQRSNKNNTPAEHPMLKKGQSYADYILECRKYIAQHHRTIDNVSSEQMVAINAPYEWHPDSKFKTSHGYRRAAIMIHGLNESAFSFQDIAHHLTEQGYLVRGVLLPGHGTTPKNLMQVSYKTWLESIIQIIRDTNHQAQEIYIYGFSLGATLALHAALKEEAIDGLVLFAPAVATKCPFAYIARWYKYIIQAISKGTWHKSRKEVDYAKYCSSSYHCMNETLKGMRAVRKLLKKTPLKVPVFATATTDDETISSAAFIKCFLQLPENTPKKIVIYSADKPKKHLLQNADVTYRNSKYPAEKILNFSHTTLHHAGDNAHYGKNPDYYDYLHYATPPGINSRPEYLGAVTAHNMRHGTLARLHFNPDLPQLLKKIDSFIDDIN